MRRKIILEDSVFFWNRQDRALFYDSRNFSYELVEKDTEAKRILCDSFADTRNLNSLEFDDSEPLPDAKTVMDSLLRKGMARVTDNMKDCAIPPRAFINGDLDFMEDEDKWEYVGEKNLYDFLCRVTFFTYPGGETDYPESERESLVKELSCANPSIEYETIPYYPACAQSDPDTKPITEKDILDAHIDRRRIFIHQKINVRYWGHLYVFPDGGICPMPEKTTGCVLGHIGMPITRLIATELIENHAWRKVRDFAPCSGCVFQWLCPSPSMHERIATERICRIM